MPGPRAGRLRRTPARGVAIVVGLVSVASLVIAYAGRPPALIPNSGAEAFVAPDGHRQLVQGDDGQVRVRETGHLPGNRAWTDGPEQFYVGFSTVEDALEAYWIVETESAGDAELPQLLRLERTGLLTFVEWTSEARGFTPPRPEVPADPRPGQRITTTGLTRTFTAPGSTQPYSSTLVVSAAAAAGEGCLTFRRTDTIADAPPVTSTRVRCRGRGVVRIETPSRQWSAIERWPSPADPRQRVDLRPPTAGPLTGLQPHPLQIVRGSLVSSAAPAGPIQVIGDRLFIASALTGNVMWLARRDGELRLEAWSDAGGDIVATGRCGDVLAVATTQRAVVAFDTAGSWLWTTTLADVAGTQLARAGEDLLVAGRDGRLTALSCRDGAQRWSVDDVSSAALPAVGPEGILVAADGGVRLLDPATGATRWQRTLPAQALSLAVGEGRAVVSDTDDRIHTFAATGGESLWTARVLGAAAIHRTGATTIVRTDRGLAGLDDHGRSRWWVPAATEASIDDGRQVFAAGLSGVVVVAADGTVTDRRDQPMNRQAADLLLSRTSDGVIAADSAGALIHWRDR